MPVVVLGGATGLLDVVERGEVIVRGEAVTRVDAVVRAVATDAFCACVTWSARACWPRVEARSLRTGGVVTVGTRVVVVRRDAGGALGERCEVVVTRTIRCGVTR